MQLHKISTVSVVILLIYILIFSGCGGGNNRKEMTKDTLLSSINKLVDVLNSDTLIAIHLNNKETRELLDSLNGLCLRYWAYFPGDSQTADILYSLAKIQTKFLKYDEAVSLLTKVTDRYRGWGKRDEALLMIAFIYDNILKNKVEAKKYYQLVIEEYPESRSAQIAAQALKIIDVPEEELVKQITASGSEQEHAKK